MAEVVGLYSYPVKGCAPLTHSEATFSERGIDYDREWMLVGEKGQFFSQRIFPQLALVETRLSLDALLLRAPGMEELAVPLSREHQDEAPEVEVSVFKKAGTGSVERDEANEYFSRFLGKPTRLLRIKQPRTIKPECQIDGNGAQIRFADGFPTLLTSMASLRELNQHMATPIPMNRFRPSIVIDGKELAPYDEDYWREVRIGALTAFVVRACARCPVPNIDQQSGILPVPKQRTVSEALRATRQGIDPIDAARGEFFGQNATHPHGTFARVFLGDTVEVLRQADEPNVRLVTSA